MRNANLSVAGWMCVLLLVPAINAQDNSKDNDSWPGFRGPRGDGVAASDHSLGQHPVELRVAWTTPLGKGYSGIAVSQGRAVTMYSDGRDDWLAAYDCGDGQQQWRYSVGQTYRGHDGSQDGPIATPYIYHDTVFTLAPRGTLIAVDLHTGTERWTVDLVQQHAAKKPHWGFGTSPRVVSGVLVVQVGGQDGMVDGFQPHDGRRLWSVGEDEVYYQAPVTLGTDRVLVAGNQHLFCLDARTGNVLWQRPHQGSGEYGAICLVPVPLGDRGLLLEHQDDASRVLVWHADRDHAPEPLWEEPSLRKSYSVSVHHDGYLYGYSGRIFCCVDASTGRIQWKTRTPGDGFPIVVDDSIAVIEKSGVLTLIRAAADQVQTLASAKVLEEICWTPPSFAGNSFYLRSFGEITRVDVYPSDQAVVHTTESGVDIAGTEFAGFLQQLETAENPRQRIDEFLNSSRSFPIVEEDGRVIFVYRGPGTDLAIGGDLTGYGKKFRMQRVANTDLFYVATRLEPDARISYAIMRDFRAHADPLNSRRTTMMGMDEEMELDFGGGQLEVSWLGMPQWQPPTHYDAVDPARCGRVESFELESKLLQNKVPVSVYLPAGYDQSQNSYPVVYLHQGHMAREALELPRMLDSLIGDGVRPLIAVFIEQDPPFFAWENYATMAAVELPQTIDGKYRTLDGRDHRAHMAWGFGCVAAAYGALAHADQAGKLAIQSPMILQTSYIEPVMTDSADAPLDVYIGWGKYDMRSELEFWDISKFGRMLDAYFRQHGYQPQGGQINEGAGVPAWRHCTPRMFEALFGTR